jgi:hypothetical protein
MNLGELRDFCGNLLDYDPTNTTYKNQLTTLLNDAQSRILSDRPWDFAMREDDLRVKADEVLTLTVSAGSATATGVGFPFSTAPVQPGSLLEGGIATIIDAGGLERDYEIVHVGGSTTLSLDRPFQGIGGTYQVQVKYRNIPLLADAMTVHSVMDLSRGTPVPMDFMSQYTRDDVQLDVDQEGTPSHYIPASAVKVQAPRAVSGVATITPGAGRGTRTINVYMVNVRNPDISQGADSIYPANVSAGLESALSPVATYNLADNEELTFTPATIPDSTGLYRRYYFTCPDLGIDAPVRVRDDGTGTLDLDTVPPGGTVTITADTRVATLTSQVFDTTSVRYVESNGIYQTIKLYPHMSASNFVRVRSVLQPRAMYEDQDVPMVPDSYAQIIAYAAMEALCLKVDNPALAQVYARKKMVLYRGMEQRFLKMVPRRIIKGAGPSRLYPNIWGPLNYTP